MAGDQAAVRRWGLPVLVVLAATSAAVLALHDPDAEIPGAASVVSAGLVALLVVAVTTVFEVRDEHPFPVSTLLWRVGPLVLVFATREHASVAVGASPRGGLAAGALAQAAALLDGRTYVLADDVKRVAVPALGHRIMIRPDLWATRITGDDVVTDVLGQVPTPEPEPA